MSIKRLLVAVLAAQVAAWQVAPAYAGHNEPVIGAQMPALVGGDCTTTVGSVVVSCATERGRPNTWTGAQTESVTSSGLAINHIVANRNGSSGSAALGLDVTAPTETAVTKAGLVLTRNSGQGGGVLSLCNRGTNDAVAFTTADCFLTHNSNSGGVGTTTLGKSGEPVNVIGSLSAIVQPTGASATRALLDKLVDPGYSVLDFGAKCDGTTNDGTVIQAAVNAAASLGVQLILAPRGKTCLVDSVGLRTNSHVRIDGTLKGAGNKQNVVSNYTFVFQTGGTPESNFVVEGDGVIDNGLPGGPNTTAQAGVACVGFYGAVQYVTVRGVTMQNCGAWPFSVNGNTKTPYAGAAHVYFSYVKALTSANAPQFQGCDDCWVDHLYSYSIGDYGFSFYSNVTRSGITNSHLEIGAGGISILADGASNSSLTTVPDSDILIQGNEISKQAGPAVYIQNNVNGVRNYHHNIQIIGNHGDHNNTNANNYWGGIAAYYVNGLIDSGNTWYGDGGPSTTSNQVGSACLYLDATASYVTSTGMTCYDESPTGGAGIGVYDAGATYVSIVSPNVYDDQATHTMQAAFKGSTGVQTTLLGGNYSGLLNGIMPNLALGTANTILGIPGVNSALPNNFSAPNLIASSPSGQVQIGSPTAANNPALLAYSSGSTTQDYTVQFSGGTAGTANKGNATFNGNSTFAGTLVAQNGVQNSSGLQAPFSSTNGPWTTYTPSLGCASGSLTSASASGRYQIMTNKTVNVSVNVSITTNGTCAGSVLVSMPPGVTTAGNSFANMMGREMAKTGKTLQAFAQGGATTFQTVYFDNTYPGQDGAALSLNGAFETQ